MSNIIKQENQILSQPSLHLRKAINELTEINNILVCENKCMRGIIENHVLYEEYLEDEFFNLGDAVMGIPPYAPGD